MKGNGYNIKSYVFTMGLDMLACSNLIDLLALKLQSALDIWLLLNTCTRLSGVSRKALHKPLRLRMLVNTR